jgi:hypothetical protein
MSLTTIRTSNLDPSNSLNFRNRIINGDMRIDQRNAGASVTPNNSYTLDRWICGASQTSKYTVQQNAGSVTPPAGFSKYLGVTSSSAYSVTSTDFFTVEQLIEGFNMADLAWGTANAKTITASFWVRSSLTGTFGGAFYASTGSLGYPFSYTISSANTWEQKTVTIVGQTGGSWATNNTSFGSLCFSLGMGSSYSYASGTWVANTVRSATGATSVVGTSGATFYITGVQLEVGTAATDFERRPYGTELALCQRYFETSYPAGATIPTALANGWTSTTLQNIAEGPSGVVFKVTKRANPTMVMYNAVNGTAGAMYRAGDANSITASFDYIGVNQVSLVRPSTANANSYYLHWTASVEL